MADALSPPFHYDNSFIPVRSRKKRKNRLSTDRARSDVLLKRAGEEIETDGWMVKCIQILQHSLNALEFLSTPIDVLCLGLGSPCSSRESRSQLAFLLKICEYFHIDRARVSVFDPAFTDHDVELLMELKLYRLIEDKHCMYPVDVPTIVFMPHCEINLYENLLKANWTLERISNVLLIGNHLQDYVAANPSRKLEIEVPCLSRLAPHLESHPLPRSQSFPLAFNNSSVQFARRATLTKSDRWPPSIPE